MKKVFNISALCSLLSALALTGCSTTQVIHTKPDGTSVTNSVTQLDPLRTANAIRAVIPPAVILAVRQEPRTRDYLQKAQLAVCIASAAGNVTPEQLKASIEASGIREIQTPEVQAAIASVYGIYQAYYGDLLAQKLNDSDIGKWVQPVLKAICDGLTEGLAMSRPTMPPATPEN